MARNFKTIVLDNLTILFTNSTINSFFLPKQYFCFIKAIFATEHVSRPTCFEGRIIVDPIPYNHIINWSCTMLVNLQSLH